MAPTGAGAARAPAPGARARARAPGFRSRRRRALAAGRRRRRRRGAGERQPGGVAPDAPYTHPLVREAVEEWLTGDGLRNFVGFVYEFNLDALDSFQPQETVRDDLVRRIRADVAAHGLNRYSDIPRIADAALSPLFPPQIDAQPGNLERRIISAIERKLRDSDEFRAALEYALARPDAELYAAYPSGFSDENDDDDELLRDRIGEDVMDMLMAGGLPAVATSFVSRGLGREEGLTAAQVEQALVARVP